jgi:hypothetical protein
MGQALWSDMWRLNHWFFYMQILHKLPTLKELILHNNKVKSYNICDFLVFYIYTYLITQWNSFTWFYNYIYIFVNEKYTLTYFLYTFMVNMPCTKYQVVTKHRCNVHLSWLTVTHIQSSILNSSYDQLPNFFSKI